MRRLLDIDARIIDKLIQMTWMPMTQKTRFLGLNYLHRRNLPTNRSLRNYPTNNNPAHKTTISTNNNNTNSAHPSAKYLLLPPHQTHHHLHYTTMI
jgi:hypothetical protein